MAAVVGKVLGRLEAGWWAQVHDFTPEGEKLEKRGRLIAVASLQNPDLDQLQTVTAGREVLARLNELYYGSLEGEPLPTLKKSLVTLSEEFPQSEIVALAVLGDVAYVSVWGRGGIWTKTGPKDGWVVSPDPNRSEVLALSGWAKPKQIFVLGNSNFWQVLTVGAVRAAVANAASTTDAAENLAAVVYGNDLGMGGVGTVVQVSEAVTQVEPEEPLPSPPPLQKKASPLISKLAGFIPKPTGPIFVSHGDREGAKKRNMYVGVGFLVILLLLVGAWQWRRSYINNQQSLENQQIEELVHKFSEARALVGLNPVRSRQLLAEVKGQLQTLEDSKRAKKDERVVTIKDEFGQVLGAATGVKQVTAEEVLDLNWIRQDMVGSKLALLEGELVVLDTQASRLAMVDPEKKSGEITAGKADLGEAKLLGVYPGKITVLSDKGIVGCQTSNNSCLQVVSSQDTDTNAVDMEMFAGNIYLLTKSGIWRHQVTDSGYGALGDWLADSEDRSVFSSSKNMAIDAYIWVMLNDGRILKYSRGVKDDFVPVDVDKPFASGSLIYTDSDAEKLYVLDRTNKRLVVLEKTGNYKSQYEFDQAAETSDFVVDEKSSKAYLLVGSKILAVGL